MKKNTVIVVTGPTASGKSALAVSLAKTLHTEIISADSRQIYSGIPIVTAVPTEEEKQGVAHHLLELLPLDAYYSAAKFQEDASSIIENIFKKSPYAIVCGGSMMYIDALLGGIDELPTVPEKIRHDLMETWKANGDDWLLEQLQNIDPDYYDKIDHNNLKRVFHAIEISRTAGQPYSSLLTKNLDRKIDTTQLDFEVVKICLSGERQKLFERINRRVIKMMEAGLEEEARSVFHLKHLNSLNTVGLKEMFSMFEGLMSKEVAVARIQKNTRVYAKKQLTWHKRDDSISYLNFEDSHEENIKKILKSKGITAD